jgi:RNA polymerase sigma factor FliA
MTAQPRTTPTNDVPSRTPTSVRTLIESNLSLVNHVVFQVGGGFPRHVRSEELVDAAALGLVEAAQRFDESRGVPFRSYAVQRIRGAVIDAVRKTDWAPRSVRSAARRMDRIEHQLAGELGRSPDPSETARALGISDVEYDRIRNRAFRSVVLALEQSVSDDRGQSQAISEVLADAAPGPLAQLEESELRSYLRDALACLPERQRIVVLGYFIEGRSSDELAKFLNVTESRVSQIRTEALANLRRGLESQYGYGDSDDLDELDLRDQPASIVERRQANYAERIAAASRPEERLDGSSRPNSDEDFLREVTRVVDRLEFQG